MRAGSLCNKDQSTVIYHWNDLDLQEQERNQVSVLDDEEEKRSHKSRWSLSGGASESRTHVGVGGTLCACALGLAENIAPGGRLDTADDAVD